LSTGVFIDAKVGHQHHTVSVVGQQVGERQLHNAVRVVGATPDFILRSRNAKQDDAFDAKRYEFGDFDSQRLTGVLHDSRQRGNRLRLRNAFAYEKRSDQVIDAYVNLSDEVTHCLASSEATRPRNWAGHITVLHTPEPTQARARQNRLMRRWPHCPFSCGGGK
jgi:hypothetical protein